jgi:phospholipid/cholesterol/gamma-HCH transport system substrate-binding protein
MRRGDPVQMRGVNIGRVVKFGMAPGRDGVQVRMEVDDEYPIPRGSRAVIQSSGLLGGMVVNIVPGPSSEAIDDGAEIPGRTTTGFSDQAEALGTQADTLLARANALVAPATATAVGRSAVEMQRLLVQLNEIAARQQEDLAALTASLRRSAAGVERVTTGPDMAQSLQNINQATAQLTETSRTLNQTSVALDSVVSRVNSGQGTLGKLTTDEELYTNLNATVANLNTATDSLNSLISDIKANPRKYINLRVF